MSQHWGGANTRAAVTSEVSGCLSQQARRHPPHKVTADADCSRDPGGQPRTREGWGCCEGWGLGTPALGAKPRGPHPGRGRAAAVRPGQRLGCCPMACEQELLGLYRLEGSAGRSLSISVNQMLHKSWMKTSRGAPGGLRS